MQTSDTLSTQRQRILWHGVMDRVFPALMEAKDTANFLAAEECMNRLDFAYARLPEMR